MSYVLGKTGKKFLWISQKKVSWDEYQTAVQQWQNNTFDYVTELDNGELFDDNYRYAHHGIDWVEWYDAPGYPFQGDLPASEYVSVDLRFAVRVTATGTDGKSVTGSFWRRQVGKSVAGYWTVVGSIGPTPQLPKTWTAGGG